MLAEDIIQINKSPYSSPVILVHKKDASWRFCVDFWAVTTIMVKDASPILTFDDLFDELKNACFFSMTDLRVGFHQIRKSNGERGTLEIGTSNEISWPWSNWLIGLFLHLTNIFSMVLSF